MRKKLFLTCLAVLLLSISTNVIAQSKTPKLRIMSLKKGQVRLTRGAVNSVVDLSKEVSGCIVVYDRSHPKTKIDTTSFTLVNSVVKGGKTYALLLAEINSGCNITGECGAATDLTFVWLKLGSSLRPEQKKAVVVQSCFWGDIDLLDPEPGSEKAADGIFKIRNGILSFKFETNLYHTAQDYSVSTVLYNTAKPENGILVTTEKRDRPKN